MKFLKKQVAIIIVVVVMICLSTFSALAVNGYFPGISGVFQRDAERIDAIFGYDGVVYKYNYETGRISSMGNTGLPKYGPTISPDGTRIAYQHSVWETPDCALQVGVMDMDGIILCDITIQSYSSNEILRLEWLDNNKFAVLAHVNPSTSEYFIFDTETGEELSRYAGYAFTALPDGTGVIYAENIPHFALNRHLAYHSLMINDEVVFTAEDMGTSFRSLTFSQDERNIAFILKPDDSKLPFKVVLAEYNKEDHGLKQLSEVDIPENIGGVLSFDENRNVCFVEETTKHTLSKESGKFTSTDILMDRRDAALDSEQYDKFRDAVSKQFGSGSLEDIFNITWIR